MRCCNQDMTAIYHSNREWIVAHGCDVCGSLELAPGYERYAEDAREKWRMVRIEPTEQKP